MAGATKVCCGGRVVSLLGFGRGERRTRKVDAVVTGAASGIGRAFAVELARRGGRVVCADVDLPGAKETAALIGERAIEPPVMCRCSTRWKPWPTPPRSGLGNPLIW